MDTVNHCSDHYYDTNLCKQKVKNQKMDIKSEKTFTPLVLSEEEKLKIRAEVRYTQLIAQESHVPEKQKSFIDKLMGLLSNGFILLLLGSLITSGLVPRFQRQYEYRVKRTELMQESLAQFLVYSNSIWQEYYSILPLTQEIEIDKKTYIQYINQIAQIKLSRYNSYAKLEALAIVFRNEKNGQPSDVEKALKSYAIDLNKASASIDQWLTALYCTPTLRERSPCKAFDPSFDAFSEFQKIKKLVITIGNENSDEVASRIVSHMKEYN